MRSAGRTLTLAELIDAAADSPANLPIDISGRPVLGVEVGAAGVRLEVGMPEMEDGVDLMIDFLEELAAGGVKLADAKRRAATLLSDLGREVA